MSEEQWDDGRDIEWFFLWGGYEGWPWGFSGLMQVELRGIFPPWPWGEHKGVRVFEGALIYNGLWEWPPEPQWIHAKAEGRAPMGTWGQREVGTLDASRRRTYLLGMNLRSKFLGYVYDTHYGEWQSEFKVGMKAYGQGQMFAFESPWLEGVYRKQAFASMVERQVADSFPWGSIVVSGLVNAWWYQPWPEPVPDVQNARIVFGGLSLKEFGGRIPTVRGVRKQWVGGWPGDETWRQEYLIEGRVVENTDWLPTWWTQLPENEQISTASKFVKSPYGVVTNAFREWAYIPPIGRPPMLELEDGSIVVVQLGSPSVEVTRFAPRLTPQGETILESATLARLFHGTGETQWVIFRLGDGRFVVMNVKGTFGWVSNDLVHWEEWNFRL